MPGRCFNGNDYRYGMNGQEKDLEIAEGIYTAEYWEYDSRLGRRWNLDPIRRTKQSPYACFNSNPIYFIDPLGLYGEPPVNGGTLPKITVAADGPKNPSSIPAKLPNSPEPDIINGYIKTVPDIPLTKGSTYKVPNFGTIKVNQYSLDNAENQTNILIELNFTPEKNTKPGYVNWVQTIKTNNNQNNSGVDNSKISFKDVEVIDPQGNGNYGSTPHFYWDEPGNSEELKPAGPYQFNDTPIRYQNENGNIYMNLTLTIVEKTPNGFVPRATFQYGFIQPKNSRGYASPKLKVISFDKASEFHRGAVNGLNSTKP